MSLFRRLLLAALVLIVVLNWTWGRLPSEPPAPPQSRYATVDGVKVHYMETPGSGPGVIMVHGHPGTFMDWNFVRQELPGMHTIAIDRPGYGYSSGGYLAFEDQVKVVHDLAAKLGIKRPIIAGHSYGGTLSVAYAERYPKQTTGIVAVDPALDPNALGGFEMVQAQFIKLLNLPVVEPVSNATFSQLMRTASSKPQVDAAFSPDPVNPDYTQQLRAVNLKSSDLKTFADETLDFDGIVEGILPGLSRISVPVTVLQGRGDKLVKPATTRRAAMKIPQVRYVSLPGGHMQTWVRPGQVAAAIRRQAG